MKKFLFPLLAIFILVATNPSLKQHQERTADVCVERLNARASSGSFFDKLKSWTGINDWAASVVCRSMWRANFLVCSFGVYDQEIISFGVLNCVFVF